MTWSSDNVLVAPNELRRARQQGIDRVPDPWMATIIHQMGESVGWYRAVCGIDLPERPVCVDLLGGLPSAVIRPPTGVEVYNDYGRAATDFFRCLRIPQLHTWFTQLHWKYGGVDLDPVKLAQLCRDDPSRTIRTYTWFRLALELFRHRRTDRGLWQDRAIAYEIFDHQDPWSKDLYDVLTDVDPLLPELHGRLMRIQYEENCWEKMLDLYDAPDTLFWIDAQPGLLQRYGQEGSSPAEFIRRLEALQGSFVLLWWRPNLPKGLRQWENTRLDGTPLTLVSRLI